MNLAPDPVRRLLDEGDALLEAGRGDQAVLAFERILLQDPAHEDARRGLERARLAVKEGERHRESLLDDAERALDAGDLESARRILEAALSAGASGTRALALTDRLDRRSGRLFSPTASESTGAVAPLRIRRAHWTRRAFAATCALGIGALAVGVAARWDELMAHLVRAPRPTQAPAPPTLGPPAATPAGRAVADAQRRLEQGDPAGALAALERVRPEDPLYPYAQQLRQQSETARRGADAR